MTSSAHTESVVAAAPRPTLWTRAAAAAQAGWQAYWERRAKRATVLILHALDERALHDIGLSPSEIESCVYGKGGDRLRRYHEAWPWRQPKVGCQQPVTRRRQRRA